MSSSETSLVRFKPRTAWVLLISYWLLMFIGTHLPNTLPILGGGVLDKVAHFSAYSLLALMMAWTAQLHGISPRLRPLACIWMVAMTYGMIDELLQPPVGRSCELLDWLADASGAAVGLGVYRIFFRTSPTAMLE